MEEINLLPYHEQKTWWKKTECLLLISVALILSFLLIWLLNTLIAYQIKQLALHKNSLSTQVASLSRDIEKMQPLKQQSTQLKSTLQIFQHNHAQIRKILFLLKALDLLAPPHCCIKTLAYQAPYLSLLISSKSEKNFLTLTEQMKKKYHKTFKYIDHQKKNSTFYFIIKTEI